MLCWLWLNRENVIRTSYLEELYSHRIHQSTVNPDLHRRVLPHNHTRNYHDSPLQTTEIWALLDGLPAPWYAKCTPCLVDIPRDSLVIPIDCHSPELNPHRKRLFNYVSGCYLIFLRMNVLWDLIGIAFHKIYLHSLQQNLADPFDYVM